MSWWELVARTIASEFSDLPDLQEVVRVATRLLVATLLGGLLGYEREYRGKAAGLRTHMLVCNGAALFVLVPLLAGVSMDEVSRVVQGIVTGVGFLGAGTILKGSSPRDVHGLTTAAGIWLTAAIGVTAGLGHEATAVLATLGALAVLHFMPALERHAARGAARKREAEKRENPAKRKEKEQQEKREQDSLE